MRNTNVPYVSILGRDGWKVRELTPPIFPRVVLSWGTELVAKDQSSFPDEVSVPHLTPSVSLWETKFRNFWSHGTTVGTR